MTDSTNNKTYAKYCKIGVLLISISVVFQGFVIAQEKPNIILLFADDAGYADFGFQGSKVMKTPHLDKLASEGVVFTQGYVSASVCGPSRAGLITGKYQQRFGYEENNVTGFMSKNSKLLSEEMGLPVNELTIGDYLNKLGYTTAIYGKWHLGNADKYHPLKRGFDEFYGFRGGDRSYFKYKTLPSGQKHRRMESGFGNFEEPNGYATDVFAEKAISFIEKNKNNPFFIYLSFNAVHTPMEAKKEDLLLFPHLTGKRKKLAAMAYALDRACGKVLNKVKELGLENNTIIVFTNDNGGPTDRNASSNLPLSGTKSNHLEGGIRVPFIMKWKKKIKPDTQYHYPISTLDLLPTFYASTGHKPSELDAVDGVDLLPYINGSNKDRPHKTLYWKKESKGVIRDMDWKLIRYPDRPAELFDISKDISEQHNLASKYPKRLKSMFNKLFKWEATLERPMWMLKRSYEVYDLQRMDKYRNPNTISKEMESFKQK